MLKIPHIQTDAKYAKITLHSNRCKKMLKIPHIQTDAKYAKNTPKIDAKDDNYFALNKRHSNWVRSICNQII
jgi:hypothetical protein